MSQCQNSHAFRLPSTTIRGLIRSSTEGPNGGTRMRFPRPTNFRGPVGSSTKGHSGGIRMRFLRPLRCFVAP
eukprot:5513584-Pyramimonas_sp.AAC.1